MKDVHTCELLIHKELNKYRIGKKEFFEISLTKAKKITRSICDQLNQDSRQIQKNETDHQALVLFSKIVDKGGKYSNEIFYDLNKIKNTIKDCNLKLAIYFKTGEFLLEQSNFNKALDEFNYVKIKDDCLLSFGITSSYYWEKKAYCYLQLDRLRQAAYCYQFIDDKFEGEFKRAELYFQLNEFNKSLQLFENLLLHKDKIFKNLINDRISFIKMIQRTLKHGL